MKPEFYEVVSSDWDSYQRLGFYKTLDDCMLVDFAEKSYTSIHDVYFIAYAMKDGLPETLGRVELEISNLDPLDLEFKDHEYNGFDSWNLVHYTFDDALVTLQVPKDIDL